MPPIIINKIIEIAMQPIPFDTPARLSPNWAVWVLLLSLLLAEINFPLIKNTRQTIIIINKIMG